LVHKLVTPEYLKDITGRHGLIAMNHVSSVTGVTKYAIGCDKKMAENIGF